ncbi:hypothetical protein RF55_14106 [Lasius niger]|uniref:Reverse transcriptase domain-containing protein n=1 Tax=Lasius niger TaxID=67767 RepID=A0A0J7N2D2_LASNI|nr:hypothetical protein RF55_14106 [Lasius niger]
MGDCKEGKRGRKGEDGTGEGIEMREWNDYFKELLGGIEGKVTLGAYGVMREGWGGADEKVMVLFFVDLKPTFDSVDRKRLVETLRERGYGVEIWCWKEREKVERLQERYLRWVMGVDWGTPGYMVMEELQRDKLRGRMGRRAWGMRRLVEEKGELARKC